MYDNVCMYVCMIMIEELCVQKHPIGIYVTSYF